LRAPLARQVRAWARVESPCSSRHSSSIVTCQC
jgi:hypothetical protein